MEAAPSRAAAAKAAIWAVASVPERRPPSCPPPRMRGGSFSPLRMYSAPTPLGAWILWPLTDSRSTPSSLGVKGTFKKPWTASQWSRARQPAALMARAASFTGRTVPSSLFTSIMDTSTVSGRRAAASCSGATRPALSGLRYVTSYPWRSSSLQVSSTAACSMAVVIMCFPRRRFSSSAPRMAQLSLSEPQDVKKTSSGRQPRAPARSARQSFIRSAACFPRAY